MINSDYNLLASMPLFEQISSLDIKTMMNCVQAKKKHFKKKEIIFTYGDFVTNIGIVLSGSILIEKEDFWGNRSILSLISPGTIFAETYALLPHVPIEVRVLAQEPCEILFLDFHKITSVCPNACSFHTQFIHNLLSVFASKNYMLTKKMEHMSQKTTREKILSYLSTQSQISQNPIFCIPYNRQQLADYLSVDRSALSNELSKLKKEGILHFHKNEFHLLKKLSESIL